MVTPFLIMKTFLTLSFSSALNTPGISVIKMFLNMSQRHFFLKCLWIQNKYENHVDYFAFDLRIVKIDKAYQK